MHKRRKTYVKLETVGNVLDVTVVIGLPLTDLQQKKHDNENIWHKKTAKLSPRVNKQQLQRWKPGKYAGIQCTNRIVAKVTESTCA